MVKRRALDENGGRLQNEEQSATWAIGLSRALSYARSTRRCLPSPNGSAKHDRAMASLVPGHSHRVRTDDVCGPIDFDVDRSSWKEPTSRPGGSDEVPVLPRADAGKHASDHRRSARGRGKDFFVHVIAQGRIRAEAAAHPLEQLPRNARHGSRRLHRRRDRLARRPDRRRPCCFSSIRSPVCRVSSTS